MLENKRELCAARKVSHRSVRRKAVRKPCTADSLSGDILTADEEMRIIRSVLGGDNGAFETLVLDNQKNVYNLALKMTKDEEDALDISQEVFLKAYSSLKSFRGESRFSVWLYRMTYNMCLDFLRRKKRAPETSLTQVDADGDLHDLDVPDSGSTPEEDVLQRELRITLAESIDELGAMHREILVMREITGMNYTDIAAVLRISEGTVKSRLARARKNLADILISKGTFPASYRHKNREEVTEHGRM